MGEMKRGKLWKALNLEVRKPPPVWLMRQAGRYLPEYQEARTRAGSFWNLCMTPEIAAEVTLQPLRRFDIDAAIIFSDILVVPHALGKEVSFQDGPRLVRTSCARELVSDRDVWAEKLAPVYAALGLVKAQIGEKIDLIGFAGGPWTLATYMAEGQSSVDQRAAKLWAYRDRAGFAEFLDLIADCVSWHLRRQVEAGATVVQIFDSWAGGLPERAFADWVVAPTTRIVAEVKRNAGDIKIIGFPRGATQHGYELYASETGVDGVSLDTAVPVSWAVERLAPLVAIQGNIDPLLLVAGGPPLKNEIETLLAATRSVPFIANLGHGVLPDTPIGHVADFVAQVRGMQ